jgi:hypothetical protein
METNINTITINGIEYVEKSKATTPQPNGNRAVIIIDRGWIAAGDVEENDGRIRLSRAVWVFRWESIGFDAMIANPEKAILRPLPNGFDIPADSEIFRVPVADDWGVK